MVQGVQPTKTICFSLKNYLPVSLLFFYNAIACQLRSSAKSQAAAGDKSVVTSRSQLALHLE